MRISNNKPIVMKQIPKYFFDEKKEKYFFFLFIFLFFLDFVTNANIILKEISTRVVFTIALVNMQINKPIVPEIRHLNTSKVFSSQM